MKTISSPPTLPTTPPALPDLRNCPVGINPIIWSNDDFQELGGATPLDRCLADMSAAGYAGAELGHKFPRTAPELGRALAAHRLRLVSGWHSTYFAERDQAAELASAQVHLDLLCALGATVFIAAECSRRIYNQADTPLGWATDRPRLDERGWEDVARGLEALAARCAAAGLRLVYHHHMGTVIQAEAELDRLMTAVPGLGLLLDPGHLAFAGADPAAVLHRYEARIAHVHLKNVRPAVVARARRERWSFRRAVVEGVFTIPGDGQPGDGSVDFPLIFRRLAAHAYRGWLVVEAEEDPGQTDPLAKARRARAYVQTQTGA
jgi:myo-inosose-2 dehydratase